VLPSPSIAFVSRTTTFALLALLCAVAALVDLRFSNSLQGTDFPDFYCAARMLADGQGHQLYNPEVQRQYQARYAGRVGTLYIHPPFEALFYLAVAWLSLRQSYLLWSLVGMAFLLLAARRLTALRLLPWDWRYFVVASLTFVPLLLCLIQGQDSLLLFLLVVLAFTDLRRGRGFAAGCWFGLALFKFQIVLPIMLVLLLTQSRRARSSLAVGFSLVALALAAVSAAISGWSTFTAYANFLTHLRTQPFAGIAPNAMANFRGITFLALGSDQSPFALTAIAILSLAAFVGAILAWHNVAPLSHPHNPTPEDATMSAGLQQFDLAFAATCLFALLISYHLNPHDLTLLLLPMLLLLRHSAYPAQALTRVPRWLMVGLCAALFLPPLHLFALQSHAYALVAIPLTGLFAASVRQTRIARAAA
jgi:hypothetical protein